MDKTVTMRIAFTVSCPEENVDELRRIVDHHIDYLIDLDNNRDIIESVWDASAVEI